MRPSTGAEEAGEAQAELAALAMPAASGCSGAAAVAVEAGLHPETRSEVVRTAEWPWDRAEARRLVLPAARLRSPTRRCQAEAGEEEVARRQRAAATAPTVNSLAVVPAAAGQRRRELAAATAVLAEEARSPSSVIDWR